MSDVLQGAEREQRRMREVRKVSVTLFIEKENLRLCQKLSDLEDCYVFQEDESLGKTHRALINSITQSTGSVFNQFTYTCDPDISTEQMGIPLETMFIISTKSLGFLVTKHAPFALAVAKIIKP